MSRRSRILPEVVYPTVARYFIAFRYAEKWVAFTEMWHKSLSVGWGCEPA
jgi:hypothetical protein